MSNYTIGIIRNARTSILQLQYNTEIERKWLFLNEQFNTFLKECVGDEYEYEQSYLSVNPEIRIRKKQLVEHSSFVREPATYRLCIKSKGTLVRKEIEKNLTEQEYLDLRSIVSSNQPVIKKHFKEVYLIQNGNTYLLTVGVVDKGEENSFCYGEIEFNSEQEARDFVAPDCYGLEVTDDPYYKMANYYQRKLNMFSK